MHENDLVLIYITYETEEEAEKICNALLAEKLIACANIYPMKSMYWWKGEIVNTIEFVSIVKSKVSCWDALQEKVEEMHSYEIPCIVKMGAEANPLYREWVRESTL